MTVDFSQELFRIDAGRNALQRLLDLTLSLETLRIGLESSLELGKPNIGLTSDAIKLYLALGKKIRNLSDRDILLRLEGLDLRVKSNLENILPLIETFNIALTNSQYTREISAMINKIETFSRQAKTAVTLRVLLHKRGQGSPALQLPVPISVIREKLALVERQEQKQRQKAEKAIEEIEADLRKLLNNRHQPEVMREVLTAAMADMALNREHLQAGLSLEDLPVSIEHINFSVEAEPPAKTTQIPIAEHNSDTGDHETSVAPQAVQKISPPGKPHFWRKLKLWLTSSWRVNWRDIKDNNRDK